MTAADRAVFGAPDLDPVLSEREAASLRMPGPTAADLDASESAPPIVITGSRQAGKSAAHLRAWDHHTALRQQGWR